MRSLKPLVPRSPRNSVACNDILGLKVVPIWGHWGQSVYDLGTWTLRECASEA